MNEITESMAGGIKMAGSKLKQLAFNKLDSAGQDYILGLISDGTSVSQIARQMGIHRPSVSMWLNRDSRQDAYLAAKRQAADALADAAMEIADTATSETVAVAKLRVDVRRWLAGTLDPSFSAKGASIEVHITAGEAHLAALRKRATSALVANEVKPESGE